MSKKNTKWYSNHLLILKTEVRVHRKSFVDIYRKGVHRFPLTVMTDDLILAHMCEFHARLLKRRGGKKHDIFSQTNAPVYSGAFFLPRAKVSPPPLSVLDTFTQGGHTDPISWCCTHPIGGHNTSHPSSIYLLVPCASVWPPSNALGCPSDNSLSRSD